MRYLTLSLLALLSYSAYAENWSTDYSRHVDENLKKMQLEGDKNCTGLETFGMEMKCLKDIRKKFEATGEKRGTDAYCRKHYLPMPDSALINKYDELYELRKTARGVGDIEMPLKGEMTQTTYAVEIGCIARELDRRGL